MATTEPSFYVEITTGPILIPVSGLWPDGDGPEYPSVQDVERLIAQCGGPTRVIDDWFLNDNMDVFVSNGPGVVEFPPKEQMKIGETE